MYECLHTNKHWRTMSTTKMGGIWDWNTIQISVVIVILTNCLLIPNKNLSKFKWNIIACQCGVNELEPFTKSYDVIKLSPALTHQSHFYRVKELQASRCRNHLLSYHKPKINNPWKSLNSLDIHWAVASSVSLVRSWLLHCFPFTLSSSSISLPFT